MTRSNMMTKKDTFFAGKKAKILAIAATGFMLSACFDSSSSNNSNIPEKEDSGIYFDLTGVDYSAITVDDSLLPAGSRLLASQCAVCHGTYGVAVRDWPDLWGSGRRISGWMTDYQDPDFVCR